MSQKKIIYLIRWIKNEKPIYQLGEIVPVGNNRYMPAPPEIFSNFNITLQAIKNKFSLYEVSLLTMGFEKIAEKLIDDFVSKNLFIVTCKHLSRPIGKKSDGTPYRVFMVDSDFNSLKNIRKIIVKEHFEIMGVARNADDALKFFEKYYRYIDILIIEIILGSDDGYEVITQMRKLKNDLKVIIVTKSSSQLDVQKAIDLKINGYIIKPVEKEKLINNIKKILP